MTTERGQWGSRVGFILAAAGSAVGLGNIWKFPYITGQNGGGIFVLVYLACILVIAMPIMMAEIFIGRAAQNSPVGAFRELSAPRSPWLGVGWMGVAAAFVILSYYSVVAGWSMHYVWLSVSGGLSGQDSKGLNDLFGQVYESKGINLGWHFAFMGLTIAIVIAGVKRGIELTARILMPLLFIMLLGLVAYAATTGEGFSKTLEFVFSPKLENLTAASVLEALGHSFFTLSLGMGALITYGSYLRSDDDLVSTSVTVGFLDTAVALLACLAMFPFVFAAGGEPAEKVGLVFVSLPLAFEEIAGGAILGPAFFLLLTFAALTSAISLLEVAVSYFIDERGWGRRKATIVTGLAIMVLGVPSALSGSTDLFGNMFSAIKEDKANWFDFFDYVASNWMLPLGGLGIALFVAWRVGGEAREIGFKTGSRFGAFYWGWVQLLRYLVPIGVIAVFLHAIGVLEGILGFVGIELSPEAVPEGGSEGPADPGATPEEK